MSNKYYSLNNRCRLTGESLANSKILAEFDSLPVPGLFFDSYEEAKDKIVPLTLVRSSSGFIQLKETINGDLYHWYKSRRADVSHTNWIETVSSQIAEKFGSYSNILEIGGGEGLLLQGLKKKGFTNLFNVDPSHENVQSEDFESIVGLFPEALSSSKYKGLFDCIIAQHFLEHVPEPVEVLKGARELLSEKGEIWLEVPDMEASALDSYFQIGIIYPLHLSYFTKESLRVTGEKAGLHLTSLEIIDHYGKSLWAKFTKKVSTHTQPEIVNNSGIDSAVSRYFDELRHFAAGIPKRVLCWGAAERAHTTYAILASFGVEAASIFDSNPEIGGKFVSGINSPIEGPNAFPDQPDHLLVLSPPNHRSIIDGIQSKLKASTMIHIPLVGRYSYEEYAAKFF